MNHLRLKRNLTGFLLVLFISGLFVLWTLTPLSTLFEPENLWKLSSNLGKSQWTIPVIFLSFFIGTCLFIPVVLIALITSMIYPFGVGLCISLVGIVLASISGYLMGRWLGVGFLPERIGLRIHSISEDFKNLTGWGVLALRIAPTPPFTITSLLSGILKIPILPFSIGSLVGMIPMMVLIQLFGSQIIDLIKDPSFLALLSVIAAVIFIFIYKKVKNHYLKANSGVSFEKV